MELMRERASAQQELERTEKKLSYHQAREQELRASTTELRAETAALGAKLGKAEAAAKTLRVKLRNSEALYGKISLGTGFTVIRQGYPAVFTVY